MTNPLKSPDPRIVYLAPFLRTVARSESEIRGLLVTTAAAAAKDAEDVLSGPGIGATVRGAQYRLASAAIHSRLSTFWRKYGDALEAQRNEAIASAVKSNVNWDELLFNRAVPSSMTRLALSRGMDATADRNVRRMINRYAHETISLSAKVYKTQALSNGWVDTAINAALGRGLGPKELAKEVRNMIRPDVRGGVSYAALRLSRTELNNANHFAAVEDNADKPYVLGMDWMLSRSHPHKDICDLLAERGPYARDNVPAKPHPQCFCFVVPKTMDDDEFVDKFKTGEFDDYLANKYGIGDEAAPEPKRKVTSISKFAAAKNNYKPGKDEAQWFSDNAVKVDERQQGGPHWSDRLIEQAAQKQGWGKPTVGSKFDVDEAVKNGWAEIHRGAESAAVIDSFRNDSAAEFHYGTGIWGNGTYFSNDPKVAEAYATGKGLRWQASSSGPTMRGAISKDAKIITYEELEEEMKFFEGESFSDAFNYVFATDPGRYAAMRGYDAILVKGRDDGTGKLKRKDFADQYVILNRTALIVEGS